VSLNGEKLFGGKKRRKSAKKSGKKSKSRKVSGRGAEALSGGKKRRKSVKKSGKRSGKRSSKRTKRSMGPSFSEQLITLANALQQQSVAGGKPKKHKKVAKPVFKSLI
jgi:hypothetical protein